jgi:nucleoside-diphosphate-sugar epimerase
MIRQNLANKRIAITGSTGFVGTALVERLLRAVPECELVLLVRPSKRHDVTERVRREIFKNDAFDRLRAELKDTAQARSRQWLPAACAVAATSAPMDGLGPIDDLATFTAATRDPLGGGGRLRLAARQCSRDQPPGPHASPTR